MQVRSAADAAKKFGIRAGQARGDYEAGVRNAGQRWQAGAEAAEEAHRTGTQEALAEGRYAKGIRKAGASKYQDNAVKLGPDRFVTGVQNAAPTYEKAVAPFVSALNSLTLAPRGSRGSVQNFRRVQDVAEAMRAVRKSQLG